MRGISEIDRHYCVRGGISTKIHLQIAGLVNGGDIIEYKLNAFVVGVVVDLVKLKSKCDSCVGRQAGESAFHFQEFKLDIAAAENGGAVA